MVVGLQVMIGMFVVVLVGAIRTMVVRMAVLVSMGVCMSMNVLMRMCRSIGMAVFMPMDMGMTVLVIVFVLMVSHRVLPRYMAHFWATSPRICGPEMGHSAPGYKKRPSKDRV